jgi:hypothetical protein
VSVLKYRESLWSEVYPGSQHSANGLQPAVLAAEAALGLSLEQRQRTVWRLDGGSGSDAKLTWLLARGYQLQAKGMNNRRAEFLAQRVRRWDLHQGAWLGEVEPTFDYGRPIHVLVKRRLKDGVYSHSYYVTTLSFPSKGAWIEAYDDRGGAEVEQFRNDKSGLGLEARRKHSYPGQKAYILLTDLAHNLLSHFSHQALVGSRFESYGPKRIVRDLLTMPGLLTFEQGRLVRVALLSQKQLAQDLSACLLKYCSAVGEE